MKFIKDKNLVTIEYCRKLKEWIKSNPEAFFAKENEAYAWCDFECWPDWKRDRNHLIIKGEICIIDREWEGRHAYVVCQFYGNTRKVKDLYFVIWVDDLKRSDWRNGYFLIPDIR